MTMAGVIDFLTICNMGILFNVLDRRTYGESDMSYMDILRMDKFDFNAISEEDRRRYVYARGLSLELVSWLHSKITIATAKGTVNIEDLQVQYITQQGFTMLQYLHTWIEEEKTKDDSRFSPVNIDSLENQLTWAMDTIPWIETSWSDTLEEAPESFFLNNLHPASGLPVSLVEIRVYFLWCETLIFSFLIIIYN